MTLKISSLYDFLRYFVIQILEMDNVLMIVFYLSIFGDNYAPTQCYYARFRTKQDQTNKFIEAHNIDN